MTVEVIGIRHHSPACAQLVAHTIATRKPFAVLIEGPSDFNPRLAELRLEHTLPVALYSYANDGERPSQCWFPFLDYSPEWVAQRMGHDAGALVRFIDLPHWQYRTLPDARQAAPRLTPDTGRPRYAQVVRRLCERFGCDGDDALWDHLFESLPHDAPPAELGRRLDLYFDELRAGEAGTEQDQAREQHMALWVAWAQARALAEGGDGLVLVVCGGWHKRAIETLWPSLDGRSEPDSRAPQDEHAAGSYLVPYEHRQVDALGGYRSGMQSPLFYQWVWQDGMAAAGERAIEHIVSRLRRRKLPLSTADLVAFQHAAAGLSRLRGHAVPLRHDILDALQSAVVKEALDTPPPWVAQGLLSSQDHPALREALLALTGEAVGRLHADTPLPRLLQDVTHRLEAVGLEVQRAPQKLVLDRRREDDDARARTLWQLKLLGVRGAQLGETRAPHAARQLRAELRFEEHWTLVQDERWFPNLIEAAVYGATLDAAARHCLLEQVHAARGDAAKSAECMLGALRAGLMDMGSSLAQQLRETLPQTHDHAALAQAAHLLLDVCHTGFWGTDTQALLEDTLGELAGHLLWLLEARQGQSPAHLAGDVRAVQVFDTLLRLRLRSDSRFILETLARFARSPAKPPGVRGAALAVAYTHGGLGDQAHEEIIALTRAVPPRDALGDFLYGLFSCARTLATESDSIVQAVHGALEGMGTDDFLVALPQLRSAFSWFPPRERGALAAIVARLLGLSTAEQSRLLGLRQGTEALLDAKKIEAQALAWAKAHGVLA
jgi:hypothetical protein